MQKNATFFDQLNLQCNDIKYRRQMNNVRKWTLAKRDRGVVDARPACEQLLRQNITALTDIWTTSLRIPISNMLLCSISK